ncbi:hypothetical protein IGB42_00173 [Andreprevotia sp. IGB-42]|uniref:hypothetical protein n=1 Tax=Andreprevotia sp. IGB-42 TaxID=2497473 RepID=UPI00157EDDC4|nr:hypothetical protein [Andreprevotia sp. IGB-42]KAF0815096.1 hypothetical protein IGB42_00173 [Andreprevotia sp. IGB-42]
MPSLRIFFLLIAALLTAGITNAGPAPAPGYAAYSESLPCVDRIGRCFDAMLAGQPVSVIADKTRHQQITAAAQATNRKVRDVYWEVVGAVESARALEITVSANALGHSEVGEPAEAPVLTIYPLDGQILQSKAADVVSPDVNVNGNAMVQRQNLLQQDALPTGRYVIAIRYIGTANWERKQVFLTVK